MTDDLAVLVNEDQTPTTYTGTVIAVLDGGWVSVSILSKGVRTVFCGGGTAVVGQQVQVGIAGNVALLMGTGGVPIGSAVDYFGASLPGGYLWADGSSFSAATYPVLAAVLGSTTLPDCRERVAVGYKAGSSFAGTLKGTGGSANAVLVSHNHQYNNQSNTTSPPRGSQPTWDVAAIADVQHNTSTEGESGTNKNLQPFIVCNKIIRAI